MKKIITLGSIAYFLLLGLSSCSKDQDELDTEKPVLSFQNTVKDTLSGGDTLHIEALATDNNGLSQVKFSIHNDFDLHTHGKNEATAFEWDTIINLSGLSNNINFYILLPEDLASGPYHLLGMLLDINGNEADLADRDLILLNAFDNQEPEIKDLVTNPAISNDEIEITTGDSLSLTATLVDGQGLGEFEILIIKESDDTTVYDDDLELSGTTYNLNTQLYMNPTWGTGDFELILMLKDE